MSDKVFDIEKFKAKAREADGEGIVLIKNDVVKRKGRISVWDDTAERSSREDRCALEGRNDVETGRRALPLEPGLRIALFGRSQYHYYKSGTGSGGMVNTDYVTGVKEALEADPRYTLCGSLQEVYDAWTLDHPFDAGHGWATEPWYQEEMPVSRELAENAAAESDAAIVIIGREAGEDQDNSATKGSYLLTDTEEEMLSNVTAAFDRVIVLLNVGNIIDMKWVRKYNPSAVLYIWQGGQEGGNGVLDVLSGDVDPSGHLTDTIAEDIEDYPSTRNFGREKQNIQQEDIYVGYRYFETFAKEKVLYPFGYGLSYSRFRIETAEILLMASPGVRKSDQKASVYGIDSDCTQQSENSASQYDFERNNGISINCRNKSGNAENPGTDHQAYVSTVSVSGYGVLIRVKVLNESGPAGKEVVQAYLEAPQGRLGEPARKLVGFAKTGLIRPGESETVTIHVPVHLLAAYDDAGVTGHKSAWVLEAGTYTFYVGDNVRNAVPSGAFELSELQIVQQLSEAVAPVQVFNRMKPRYAPCAEQDPDDSNMLPAKVSAENAGKLPEAFSESDIRQRQREILQNKRNSATDSYTVTWEPVPLRTVPVSEKRRQHLPETIPQTGDLGIRLQDVASGKVSMKDFIGQLSTEDLVCIVRGEGMNSPKVTPGTGGALGGVTDSLLHYGIPIGCVTDGPSGIRMDCGTVAFSMPDGTLLACTWNEKLQEELYQWEGLELRKNHIDAMLGPGMNIHRNPLNGRNFEYFSEDPLVSGKCAAAQLRGLQRYDVTGVIKHFAMNTQEAHRTELEAVVSERAARELYLRGFEIAVKEGHASAVMTTYGAVNGFYTSSCYDLVSQNLRDEWGFTGIVMTDWWAKGNDEGQPGSLSNEAAMIRAQNDLNMVTASALDNTSHDNSMEALGKGKVTIGEYQRCAANICRWLITKPAYLRAVGQETDLDRELAEESREEPDLLTVAFEVSVPDDDTPVHIDPAQIPTGGGESVTFLAKIRAYGNYRLSLKLRTDSEHDEAQYPLSIFMNGMLMKIITLTGADREWQQIDVPLGWRVGNLYVKFFFTLGGMEVGDCTLQKVEEKDPNLLREF